MKIKRPVVVKMVLTDKMRLSLEEEYQTTIQRMELELEQLQFQSKKMLQDSAKKGSEAYRIVNERLQKEEKSRRDKINHVKELQKQLSLLPNGSEMVHSHIESEVEVNVGDHWDKLIGKTEIIVEDGIVIEIRD